MYVLKRVAIGPDEICSFIIGDACGDIFNPTHEWDVVFPPVPKPNIATPKAPTEVFNAYVVRLIIDFFQVRNPASLR